MLRTRFSLIAVFIFSCCFSSNSQERAKAYLFDDFANEFCSDPLRARIDHFLTEVQRNPGSSGYVLATADATIPGKAEQYENVIRTHVRFRRFESDRIKFQNTKVGDSTRFQFWIVPKGANPPENSSDVQFRRISATTLFNSSRIDNVEHGKVEFGEGIWSGGEPCDFGLDLGQFARAIKSNAGSTGYLIATAKSRREVAKTEVALRRTALNLIKDYKIPRSRIRTIYAGVRKESEMQLWIVPKGGHMPKFRIGVRE